MHRGLIDISICFGNRKKEYFDLREDILLTKTSLSPTLGMEALSLNFSASKPDFPSTVHDLIAEGAIVCIVS